MDVSSIFHVRFGIVCVLMVRLVAYKELWFVIWQSHSMDLFNQIALIGSNIIGSCGFFGVCVQI